MFNILSSMNGRGALKREINMFVLFSYFHPLRNHRLHLHKFKPTGTFYLRGRKEREVSKRVSEKERERKREREKGGRERKRKWEKLLSVLSVLHSLGPRSAGLERADYPLNKNPGLTYS